MDVGESGGILMLVPAFSTAGMTILLNFASCGQYIAFPSIFLENCASVWPLDTFPMVPVDTKESCPTVERGLTAFAVFAPLASVWTCSFFVPNST